MKTKEEILNRMVSEMPFYLDEKIMPYILEAMSIFKTQKNIKVKKYLDEGVDLYVFDLKKITIEDLEQLVMDTYNDAYYQKENDLSFKNWLQDVTVYNNGLYLYEGRLCDLNEMKKEHLNYIKDKEWHTYT